MNVTQVKVQRMKPVKKQLLRYSTISVSFGSIFILKIYSSNSLSYKKDEDVKVKSKANEAEEKFAACSLSIGVGSFSDPPDIPGLAHFLEHMVFMGSEKYPQENGFDEFIKVIIDKY